MASLPGLVRPPSGAGPGSDARPAWRRRQSEGL